MKLKQISFKIISLIMVFTMLFSISATTISAATANSEHDHDNGNESTDKVYVSLGDSMTNGYGLPGYEEWNSDKNDFENYFGFLVETPDAYPNKVAEKFGWDLIQLATSGLRADDIYYLLNYGTENAVEWDDYGNRYMVDKFNNTYFGTDEEVIAQVAAKYQAAIKDADVISVNVGSNNFATLMHMRMSYLLGQITGNTFMFGGYDGEFDFNEIVGDLEPEVRADLVKLYEDLKVELFAVAEESGIPTDFVLNEQNGVTLGYVLEDIATAAAYTTAGFAIGYAGILDTIHRENSDAEVIIVELTNWFAGKVFSIPAGEGVLNLQLGDMFDSLYEFASAYMAAVATGYAIADEINETPAQNIYFAEVEEDVELIIDEIVKNSNIDLEALYEIEDADERFEAALEIAKGISHDVIPDGSVRARLIKFLGEYVIKGFLGAGAVPTVAQINAIDTYIDHYYSDEFTIDIGYGDMDREAFESVFATFPDCGGAENCPYPYCQTCIGCPLNMYLGTTGVENLVGCIAYLGIEKSMIASLSYKAIEVDDLLLAADFNKLMEASQKALEGHMGSMDDVAAGMIANSELATVSNMLFSFMVGDGAILHPSVAGHQTITDAIVKAYNEKNTANDVTINNLIFAAETLVNLVVEYHDEAYAYGYAELKEAGVIAELQNALTEAQAELAALKAELVEMEADEQYAKLISLLVTEIGLTDATIAQLLVILEHETLTAETWQELDLLCDLLVEHCYSIVDLAAELGVIGLAHTEALIEATIEETERLIAALKAEAEAKIAELKEQLETAVGEAKAKIEAEIARLEAELEAKIAELEVALEAKIAEIKAEYEALKSDIIELKNAAEALINNVGGFVEELYNVANEYLDGALDEAFAAFVDAAVAAAKRYAPEVADFIYNWLYNNPEKVIGFFAEYGDEMVDFLKANAKEITAIIAYIVYNYGEDVAEYVLENADVILCALVNWIDVHGENAWALIKVYLDALGVSFELDLDLTTPEGLIDAFNKVTGLLAKLVAMIADGVYDYLEALDVIDEIEAALAELKAYVAGVVEEKIDAIKEAVDAKIAEIKAAIEAEIAAIKAEIEAKIAALKAELENAVGEAKEAIKAEIARLEALLEAKVAELEAKLEALVKAEIENLEDLAAALKDLAIEGLYDLGELVYEIVTDYVDAAVKGSFTPTEDSYYVSVNGGSAYYAELLAEKLAEKLDVDSINLGNTTWDNLDYEMLSKADLITIGYDENELSAFAVEQMLAYIANYADVTLRNSTSEYISNVFGALQAWVEKNELNYNLDDAKGEALAGVNGVIDEILAYELIAGKEIADMNWTELVGAENVKYVDDARATLKAELLGAGVIETYTYTIDVVDYIYANADELGIPAAVLTIVPQATAYKILGENAYYTVEVPVADAIVFAAESYLYNYVSFNVAYGKLIVDLYEINPDATIILLGAYNAYDVELTLGDVSLNLGEAYSYIAGVSSVQPYVYALLSSNVAYVDISDAETVYESYVAAGVIDNSLLNFAMLYLADSSITDASVAGNEYIYEQILGMLTVGCAHEYDNECDETCNKCGAVRVVAGHVYDGDCDETCNACGAVREGAGHKFDGCRDGICNVCGATRATTDHVYDNCLDKNCNKCGLERTDAVVDHYYDNCYDTKCDLCGETREAEEHAYDNCDDVTCYKCNYVREAEEHVYDDCGDASCNKCGVERVVTDHVYDSACDADCNKCGETRTVGEHVYSGCTDTDCNKCGASRTAGAHVADDCEDAICNVCGQNIAAIGHSYGEWKVTAEATRNEAGEKSRVCTKCNHTDTKVIGALGGISGGAIAAIVIGAVVVAGAAGFAIYWFIIQKKTFAQFLALFNKNAAEVVVSADAPAADASNEAPANEETPAE